MPDREFLIMILQIVSKHGNINYLAGTRFDYPDIVRALKYLEEKGYIYNNEITTEGQKFLLELNHIYNRRGIYRYISPSIDDRIIPVGIDEVYVPIKKIEKGELF